MIFKPQEYRLKDERMQPFLDAAEIDQFLRETATPTLTAVQEVIDRSMHRERLSLRDTAVLLNADSPEAIALIQEAAQRLKREIYGNRIVLFAPLYIGNKCINNCTYCGFRTSNQAAVRQTLSDAQLRSEVDALEEMGHKRLILVYGEHPLYSPEYIAHTVRLVYGVKKGPGEIRRVNINAAPLDVAGFRTVKAAGIGTYQIFQETYHPEAYKVYHQGGRKMDYDYRLTALDRAMEAGIDDVGIGALFGLHDWRFEVMGLVRHTNHLEACYGVGPHTISFPRIQSASELDKRALKLVSDEAFLRLVAILRLAVPYTGLIMTAREPASIRDRLIRYGVSQIDAGTRLEIGAYSENKENAVVARQNLDREQFEISDSRSLGDVLAELAADGYLPSFCTACYRKGRTGEHFMEFSTEGFIKRFCTPNALLTFAEYLEDYADVANRQAGWQLIARELVGFAGSEEPLAAETRARLDRIRGGARDILF